MSAQHGAAIVVGVDGSADSDRAVDWAAATAVRYHAPLHLVCAIRADYELPLRNWDERSFAEGVISEARARVKRAITVTSELIEAPAVPALITAGKNALMTVVGSRGHGALSGLLLGSVSQHMSRHASCPVVVVREPANPKARRLVVGVDGSPSCEKAIGFALDLASRNKAPLVALHGWHDRTEAEGVGMAYPAMAHVGERIDAGKRLISEALAGLAEKYPDVAVTSEAIPVHPTRALADASQQAALLVVGSRGRGEFAGLMLGSVSQSVLHQAHCPVAVVR
jgi:nucleotide-binding universal stress UspA family protein